MFSYKASTFSSHEPFNKPLNFRHSLKSGTRNSYLTFYIFSFPFLVLQSPFSNKDHQDVMMWTGVSNHEFHDQQFYILTSLSTYFSVCLYVCVHRLVSMHPHVSIHQCLSIKQIYLPGNKDCHNPVFVSPKWKWLLGNSILRSKNLRTLHFEMIPNAVRTAQVFSHVKRIYWLCLTDNGKAQAVPVLT